MSRNSPYQRGGYHRRDHTPSPTPPPHNPQPLRLVQKSRMGKSVFADTTADKKRQIKDEVNEARITQKKRMADPTMFRLETLIDQNRMLLAENSQLSKLLDSKCEAVMSLQRKLQNQVSQQVRTLQEIEHEKNKFMLEFDKKTRYYQSSIESLMKEIKHLYQEKQSQAFHKEMEIQTIREKFSQQNKVNVDVIAANHRKSNQLQELQIKKLRHRVDEKDHLIQAMTLQHHSLTQKLHNEIQTLSNQINHINHINKIEHSEQKLKYENIIDNLQQQCNKDKQIHSCNYENEIKKIKKQLETKQNQITMLEKAVNSKLNQNSLKDNQMEAKKIQLQNQVLQLEIFYKQIMTKQSDHLKEMNKAEVRNLQMAHSCQQNALKLQNDKLKELNEAKMEEINSLYAKIDEMCVNHKRELQTTTRLIQELKDKMRQQQAEHQQQQQLFKQKCAILRESDLHALKRNYENQIKLLVDGGIQKDEIIRQNRLKVHKEIQEKTQLRKQFDLEVEKYKIRIGQLQLRLLGAIAQKKEQIKNLSSQAELTSMTLIQETKHKDQNILLSQQQKNKLKALVLAKDKQIQQLNNKIALLKKNHLIQINDKNDQIAIIKKSNEELVEELKKERAFFDNELQKKEATFKNSKEFYQAQITRLRAESNQEYEQAVNDLSNTKLKLQSELGKVKAAEAMLKDELSLAKSHREVSILESQAAIEEEKKRISDNKTKSEQKLKQFFQGKLREKDKEVSDLKQRIVEQEYDMNLQTTKYNKLERKLENVLEAQQKLKSMETKIIALGQENNLVKNLADIVKHRKKQ